MERAESGSAETKHQMMTYMPLFEPYHLLMARLHRLIDSPEAPDQGFQTRNHRTTRRPRNAALTTRLTVIDNARYGGIFDEKIWYIMNKTSF
ncbi:Uncharacterized protein HZ326_0352 [Fusarium oxysporum f. sp. albedinis]|nr:Uncharacterized protein HZ326_0352 [Fusarium oxysporum f. sp. albedinis]